VAKTNFAEVALNTPAYRQYKTQKRRLTSESGFNMIRPPYPKAVRHFCRIKIAPPKFMRDFEGFFSL
jgi:hypothetical protein